MSDKPISPLRQRIDQRRHRGAAVFPMSDTFRLAGRGGER